MLIDKTTKTRYILCYKCDEKECAPFSPYREPGAGGSPARQRGALSLLSRSGEADA